MGQNIQNVINDAEQYLKEEQFSTVIIEKHKAAWTWLMHYAEENGFDELSKCLVVKALKTSPPGYTLPISRLFEYQSDGFYLVRRDVRFRNPGRFSFLVDEYRKDLLHRNLAAKTVKARLNAARRFFNAMDRKLETIELLTAEEVTKYLISLRKELSPKSVSVMVARLRDLIDFLNRTCDMSENPSRALKGKCARAEASLPTGFTAEEVSILIDVAAASEKRPKMKVAIILLHATYGLRSGEVINLTFDDIDWVGNKIHINKRKNKEPLVLDLLESVKLAIIDYVKHERPVSELRTIFLTEVKPHRPYADSATMYNLVTNLCLKAEIDISNRSHGTHAIRHSVATSMLDEGEAYETIGSVLGQGDISSPRTYLDIDVERLRKAALEVPRCLA